MWDPFFIRDVTKIKLRANASLSEKLPRNFNLHFMCVDFLWLNVTLISVKHNMMQPSVICERLNKDRLQIYCDISTLLF